MIRGCRACGRSGSESAAPGLPALATVPVGSGAPSGRAWDGVVEAVQHHLEHGKEPVEATRVAMKEVSGPVVAIGLVLCAVFVPVAFMGGVTGQLYKQFALTIAVAVVFSVINALTLSPALCALMLKKPRAVIYTSLCFLYSFVLITLKLAYPLIGPLVPFTLQVISLVTVGMIPNGLEFYSPDK